LYSIDISSVPEIKSERDPEELLALVALQEGDPNRMSIRTTRKIVKFGNPFTMEGIGRVLPAGTYEVVTDEELIEDYRFPSIAVLRR
jgi:hypothetical protein